MRTWQFWLLSPPSPGTIVDEGLPKQLLTFCQEIAEGMRYLSRRGFVHRDLAARNILISKELSCKVGALAILLLQTMLLIQSLMNTWQFIMMNYLFQIADFGLSKKLADDTEYYVTSGGLVPLKWTAPEVSVLYMHTIMLGLNPLMLLHWLCLS